MRENKQHWFLKWLKPAGGMYRGMARARRARYEDGRLVQKRLPRPVISVGNLTVGGTGKTPVVQYLCEKLSGWGHSAILTRGYGRRNKLRYLPLPPARRLDAKASRFFGDEPVMLARRLVNTSIHVGPNRYRCGLRALSRDPVDVFILDDGFQHMQLHRDVDIVVLDGQEDLRELETIPAGPLRESVSALRRADIVIINHCDENGNHCIDKHWLSEHTKGALVVTMRYELSSLQDYQTGTLIEAESLAKIPLFAFCGIANPDSFMDILGDSGLTVSGHRFFRDHTFFKEKELAAVSEQARQQGAKALITTEKDSVRLLPEHLTGLPVYVTEIKPVFFQGEERLWEAIGEVVRVG